MAVRRLFGLMVLLAFSLGMSGVSWTQPSDNVDVLNREVEKFFRDGNYRSAMTLAQWASVLAEKKFGPNHPTVAMTLTNLALLYARQGRYAEAEPLYKRSLAIDEAALGPNHPSIATTLNNLALLYARQGRYAEAEPLYRRSLVIDRATLGPNHPSVATTLNNLAGLYETQGRYTEAEPLYQRSLAIDDAALGPKHPSIATTLNNLAGLYTTQGRYAVAEPLYKRSLAITEAALGPEHPSVSKILNNLARLALSQGKWAQAMKRWKRATASLQRGAERGLGVVTGATPNGETQRQRRSFEGLVKATYRIAVEKHANAEQLANEAFEAAQWGTGAGAAASLAQKAADSATGSPDLAALVRDRDARLTKNFPNYAALSRTRPIRVADVQAQLRDDEALVLFLDTDNHFKPLAEETFVWIITKSDVRWLRSKYGTATLKREVAALRCGLDAMAWHGDGALRCADLLELPIEKIPQEGEPLPFDTTRTHALYDHLLGEAADLIKDKKLLVVPSGALTKLPFQVLVTEPPKPGASFKDMAWLARSHAITVLPSVASLQSLRRVAKPSRADRPMIGFGNPLLDGPSERYAALARRARYNQRCRQTRLERFASVFALRASAQPATAPGGIAPVPIRGGLAKPAHLNAQIPLPETANELCAVARDVGADMRDVRLGSNATETEIKKLSAAGDLSRYRIVHFATHGKIAGQLSGTTEPGLILTPPATATKEDDGYLSGSEIASLKLDADWVILSACNTAGGADDLNAEALSGLAQVFFYAGARALLVSHWEVYSDATVKLVTSAIQAISDEEPVGRAEALRRAMLEMIDAGAPHQAHPSYWAPFVVVGEGAVVR